MVVLWALLHHFGTSFHLTPYLVGKRINCQEMLSKSIPWTPNRCIFLVSESMNGCRRTFTSSGHQPHHHVPLFSPKTISLPQVTRYVIVYSNNVCAATTLHITAQREGEAYEFDEVIVPARVSVRFWFDLNCTSQQCFQVVVEESASWQCLLQYGPGFL